MTLCIVYIVDNRHVYVYAIDHASHVPQLMTCSRALHKNIIRCTVRTDKLKLNYVPTLIVDI